MIKFMLSDTWPSSCDFVALKEAIIMYIATANDGLKRLQGYMSHEKDI